MTGNVRRHGAPVYYTVIVPYVEYAYRTEKPCGCGARR